MSRGRKIALIAAGSLLGLVLLLVVSAFVIAQTDWFRQLVRSRIVREVETATGGRAEIGSFDFDWRFLKATIDGFVIHGLEPAGSAPLFRARQIRVELKIVSVFKRAVDLAGLDVEQPQANILVFADGRTNIPEPKIKRQRDRTALETIVDLAVRRFNVNDGLVVFDSRRTPFHARGENLRAQLSYDPVQTLYRGEVAFAPLYLDRGAELPLELRATLPVVIDQDRIEVNQARFESARSTIVVSGAIENMKAPRGSWRANARLALDEFARPLRLQLPFHPQAAPPLEAEIHLNLADEQWRVASARLGFGASNLEASGMIRDFSGPSGTLEFNARVALNELGRLLRLEGRPEGLVQVGGTARFDGTKEYTVEGKLAARDVSVTQDGRRFSGLSATSKLEVRPGRIELDGLRASAFDGAFTGQAVLERMATLRVDGQVDSMQLEALLSAAGAGEKSRNWSGQVSGPVHFEANLKGRGKNEFVVRADVGVTPGTGPLPVSGRVKVDYDSRRETVEISSTHLSLPHTRVDVSGSLGRRIDVRLASTDLNDLLPLLRSISPGAPAALPVSLRGGTATFEGALSGRFESPVVDGRVVITDFAVEGRQFDRLTASVHATPAGLSVQDALLTRGQLQVQLAASLGLRNWRPQPDSPLTGTASFRNAGLAELAALAGYAGSGFSGTAAATLTAAGTYGSPRAAAGFSVEKGTLFEEPFDRIEGKAAYAGSTLEVPELRVQSGPARLDLAATYTHAAGNLRNGRLQFRLNSNPIEMAKFPPLMRRWPGVAGVLQVAAQGTAGVGAAGAGPVVRLTGLDGSVKARKVTLNEMAFGDLTLVSETQAGVLNFTLDSDFARSTLRGQGTWRLSGDYPVDAKVEFSQVRYSAVRQWLRVKAAPRAGFDAIAQGVLTVHGPAFRPEKLQSLLEVSRFEAGPVAEGPGNRLARTTLRNDGSIVLALEGSAIRVKRARLIGPQTQLEMSGAIALQQKNPLDLKIKGQASLNIVQDFYPEVFADGNVGLAATVRGAWSSPLIGGRLELKDASVNLPDFPTGISNANGVILFDGSQATIQQLQAESGGGKVTVSGFAAYGGPTMVFRLQTEAAEVRIRYPEGLSTTANANLVLTGTTERSTLTGTVTITRTVFQPRSDFGTILVQTAEPVRTPAARRGFLAGLRFDVSMQTAAGLQLQTALARDLQAEANLRLRGTGTNPSLQGRVNITQGEILFFGTSYDIQQGSINFYNPVKIEPVLNIDLETRARGVNIILNVSGPINRLNLTHRSDPPLQFSEVVALLATGRTPTSDPALVARQNLQPQTWQQMGASSLLGSAIANPIAGRLQRFFGVSRLKIDPSISGVENNPQARLTLEQQITRDITFTYITNLSRSNYQIVRVEWAVNREWSVVALREENGLVGLDFLYKKRFK